MRELIETVLLIAAIYAFVNLRPRGSSWMAQHAAQLRHRQFIVSRLSYILGEPGRDDVVCSIIPSSRTATSRHHRPAGRDGHHSGRAVTRRQDDPGTVYRELVAAKAVTARSWATINTSCWVITAAPARLQDFGPVDRKYIVGRLRALLAAVGLGLVKH